MMKLSIKHLLLSLLLLCTITLSYGKVSEGAGLVNKSVEQSIDGLVLSPTNQSWVKPSAIAPLDIIKNPSLLDDRWDLKPVPLSQYTEEEKRLQRLINDKTATAVKTYSTPEQAKEWAPYDHEEITPYTWKIVDIALTEANGKTFNASLLRPNWWILNIGADKKGNRFYLKIPEVAEGSAVVTNIRVNQLDTRLWDEQREGDFVYRPITATFEHDSNQVLNLHFASSKDPVGVTAEHPFYSLDQQAFVRADALTIGEKVKTHQGQTTLQSKAKLEGTHRVHNIEVYKDHNYMVSMDGLLVHNAKGGGRDFDKYQPDIATSNKLKELNDNLHDYSYCTECAETLMAANNGKGKIIIFSSKDAPWGNKYSWDLNSTSKHINISANKSYTYHSVYTDGRYIYDPFMSSKPMSQSEYVRILNQQNPNGISWRIKGESDSPDIPELKKGNF